MSCQLLSYSVMHKNVQSQQNYVTWSEMVLLEYKGIVFFNQRTPISMKHFRKSDWTPSLNPVFCMFYVTDICCWNGSDYSAVFTVFFAPTSRSPHNSKSWTVSSISSFITSLPSLPCKKQATVKEFIQMTVLRHSLPKWELLHITVFFPKTDFECS